MKDVCKVLGVIPMVSGPLGQWKEWEAMASKLLAIC